MRRHPGRGAKDRTRQRRSPKVIVSRTAIEIHLRFDGLAGPQPFEIGRRLVKYDLYRDSLYNFYEVPCGVFRRQQSESAAGANLKTLTS